MNPVFLVPFPESFRRYLQQHMTEDHEKLDGMLDDVVSLAAHCDLYAAARRFGEFRIRQERHIAVEEEIAFPLLQTASPDSALSAEVKAENGGIRRAMDAVGRAISVADRKQFENVFGELRAALNIHVRHEDELLASAMQSGVCSKDLLLRIARL